MSKSSFLLDFKAFVMRGNVVDMAVGVIIGGAFGKIISSVVADIIMQPVETRLLRAAQAAGHPVHPGSYMLSEQLGCYKKFFGI